MARRALRVLAGPRARQHLLRQGLVPQDVRVVPGAAGGPKGLVLNPLDRFLFGHWLPQGQHTVHLLGASIGAWRMAAACRADAESALSALCDDYITQDYPHAPGRAPSAASVSERFARTLSAHLSGAAGSEVLSHPRHRLHVFTSHGRGLLSREGRWLTPLGFAAAFAGNGWRRQALGLWLERVVFSDPRAGLPFPLDDLRGLQRPLHAGNLQPAVLASCAIPFWLQAVHDIPDGPRGAYWDGGLTDYHLHLSYAGMDEGLVLYPHFQAELVPGWLDKAWARRHRSTPALDNVLILAPRPDWVASLPGGKLPDRSDFKTFAGDLPGRMRRWRQAVAESQRLADEAADWLQHPDPHAVEPL